MTDPIDVKSPQDREVAPTQSNINTNGGAFIAGNVDVKGNFTARDSYHLVLPPKMQRFLRLCAFAIVGLIGVIAVSAIGLTLIFGNEKIRQVSYDWGLWNAFPSEGPDETLIVIAQFTRTDDIKNSKPHEEIQSAILEAVKNLVVNEPKINLRVEIVPDQLGVNDKDAAEKLGKRYNASLVIWGGETAFRSTINFFNLKQPTSKASKIRISETERSQDVLQPEAYKQFITNEMPKQMSFWALFAIGQSYYSRGESGYEASLKTIETAIKILPANTNSITGLSDAYFRLGWLYQKSLKLDVSVSAYTEAIRLNPDEETTYNNRGVAYAHLKRHDYAVEDYNKAIKLNSNLAAAYNNRGLSYIDQKKYELAITDFNKAIRLDPSSANKYINRGSAYGNNKQYEQAIQDFNEAIRLDPQSANAYYNRGVANGDLFHYEQAIQDFNEAIRLDPTFAKAYLSRGAVYYNIPKQYDLGIKDFGETIRIDPTFVMAFYNRGLAYSESMNYAQAIKDFDEAIRLDSSFADFYIGRGRAYEKLGQYQNSIEDYNRAIDLNPKSALAYNSRGFVYYISVKYEQAIDNYNKAIQLDPIFAPYYNNRGSAYDALGRYEQAANDFNAAILLDPTNARFYKNRGTAYPVV